MGHILIWDSIAKRRRSISDTFYDNGLGTLKGYLEERGHTVEIIDWARNDFFQALSWLGLAKLLRNIYSILFAQQNILFKNLLGALSVPLQEILSVLQHMRLKRHLLRLAKDIKRRGIRIVGVKIWYGEAFTNAKYFVNLLRKIAPDIITIAGGYHVTLYEEHILQTSNFDLGVACEGEYALEVILQIADRYKNQWNRTKALEEIAVFAEQGKIDNLIFRKSKNIYKTQRHQLNTYSLKTIPRYCLDENKVRIHVMVESLGCDWGRCNFCVHPYFYPRYSLRVAEEIITEIKEMLKNGIGIFRFAGSDTPPFFGVTLAQKIMENNLKVIFGIGSRPIRHAQEKFASLVDSYKALISAGLTAVFMGGETGNAFINQEAMNKGVCPEDIIFTIKALREAETAVDRKVYLSLALIYPVPLLGKVTLEEVESDNINLLKEAMPDSVMITPPGPFLHTKWYDEREKFGFGFEKEILNQAMEYEYVLYKPVYLWPKLGVSLEGKSFKQLLGECGRFRAKVEKELHIPTDISDEHFLMFYAAGFRSKEEIQKIKTETMLDIVSCDYSKIDAISQRVNEYSGKIALSKRI